MRVLDRISIQMRDLKQQMKEKDIKVAYKGRRKELYDALQYDLFIGRKNFSDGICSGKVEVDGFRGNRKSRGRAPVLKSSLLYPNLMVKYTHKKVFFEYHNQGKRTGGDKVCNIVVN